MASPFHPSTAVNRPGAYHAPAPAPNAPPGTFAPGTKVQVGNHRVVIEKYLSEGGFAHVYVVRVPNKTTDKTDVAVLKRVAVPDKDALANMRTEVETMKKLKGHRHIVTYIDSHASQLKGGGYEVFLLMEFCQGGGLIDFMNTRLQHRLTEPEILKIFSDVAEGVACMHYLKPPLLHRDLKVENVLISTSGSSRLYKLCDFGSSAPPRPAATTAAEGRLIEDDVQRHTTMQYRSPEMIDVYRKQPIDEKSDIWALGVLLYKLCYYTTPFEEQGQMAILNATYRFPPYPAFSDRTKSFIASMLKENPQSRPNIYQVVREVCAMRNTPCPIKDIYADRTHSESRHNQQLPSPEPVSSPPPMIGLQKAAPIKQVQAIPEITPMRRGRPTAPTAQPPAAKPSPSPLRGSNDPFAALDSQSLDVRAQAADELAAKFPSLDEFSILHERGNKFQFGNNPPAETKQGSLIQQRVAQALADEAFSIPASPPKREQPPVSSSGFPTRSASLRKTQPMEQKQAPREISSPQIVSPTPQRPQMVSTGTMTSQSPSPPKFPDISSRPIYRFPPPGTQSSHARALSQPRAPDNARSSAPSLGSPDPAPQRPSYLDINRSKSSTTTLTLPQLPQSPSSSRPSLEMSRPNLDASDPISRSKSANSRARPSSVHVESSLEYLREREASRNRVSKVVQDSNELHKVRSAPSDEHSSPQEKNIESNVDFLRSMEDDGAKKKEHRRTTSTTSKHSKRSSMNSLSLSNTKNILAGRFGDAFRRFEGGGGNSIPTTTTQPISNPIPTTTTTTTTSPRPLDPPLPLRTPSPDTYPHHPTSLPNPTLTPIAGSEPTTSLASDPDDAIDRDTAIDETQDLPPEVRRELERRRLSAEEKRVADAAAEYRRRVAEGGEQGGLGGGPGGQTRASTIQNRVRSLLDDSKAGATVQRTAEGYGRFTRTVLPAVASSPLSSSAPPASASAAPSASAGAASVSAPPQHRQPTASSSSASSRPNAPPKPRALRTGGAFESGSAGLLPGSPVKRAVGAVGLMGERDRDRERERDREPIGAEDRADDWEESFSRRYPSLSGIELVEAEV
ncbi:hypothetical protein K490DRAFT_103, partial [Saccharata proteae CBS 121410]